MSYVLIVDDDKMVAEAIADLVDLYDWHAKIVHGPRAAFDQIHRDPPALVLLDLNMPGVDGFEVMSYIRRDPIAEKTPIVFVTAEDDQGTRDKAKEAGALDYLIKPVDPEQIEAILNKIKSPQ
ncbi:MAG: response regulator [Chloroflexi bacterium]|nr:response regulator [Chloroflexota bacterium]